MEISCSKETAYTVANLRFALCKDLRETRFHRFIERYLLIDRNGNPELDKKMEDPNVRLIKQYVFPTTEGTVVVIDYQVRKGRTVGTNGTI
jgi:hypothetical protein